MIPRVVVHNSVSLDGSLTGFEPNMELHYAIAGVYQPQAHLIGSQTVKAGIELYGDGVPCEVESDFQKPKRDEHLPWWVFIDSRGILQGMLHAARRFEYCRDVVVLVSESTPKAYLTYLKDRSYDFHVVGADHVDLRRACVLLSEEYGVKTLLTDTGRVLGNLLLNQGLVDELSVLVHPVVVGQQSFGMFSDVQPSVQLKLVKSEQQDGGCVWLVYDVVKEK